MRFLIFRDKPGFSSQALSNIFSGIFVSLFSGCGGGKLKDSDQSINIGFSLDYNPPDPNYDEPLVTDPYFKSLELSYSEPYWTSALQMDSASIVTGKILSDNNRIVFYSFPVEKQEYLPISITGWSPATSEIVEASQDIFNNIEAVLNIHFKQVYELDGFNTIAISQSIQSNTAGYSYYPNNWHELGSDIFISKDYARPASFDNGLTNYDYELLLHEIGHALGLKHPFSAHGLHNTSLNDHEDNTNSTAMSYDEVFSSFNGLFRPLDLMVLTKLYGVNPSYMSGDDVYRFNSLEGVFIIDGDGNDTINASDSFKDIFIDLRPATHSYENQKSIYITDPYQLTISHNTQIENVQTGSGDDYVIGNDASNFISTASGNDKIFAGNGVDLIDPGSGIDTLDLSESDTSQDTYILKNYGETISFDTVYGFAQGLDGDVIVFSDFVLGNLTFLPLVDGSNVPFGYINNCLVSVYGENLSNSDELGLQFRENGLLENLKLQEGNSAFLIISNSQSTGEDQHIYNVSKNKGKIDAIHLAQMIGNNLDIDNWTAENFLIT